MTQQGERSIDEHAAELSRKYAKRHEPSLVHNYALMGTFLLDPDIDDPSRPEPTLTGLKEAAYMYASPDQAKSMLTDEELTKDIIEIQYPERST